MSEAVALRSSDVAKLARCEAVIESGLRTFVEVGEALMEIRDSRLYRDGFGTFEDYCQERWSLKRQRAYEIMDAAAVVSEISDTPPDREAHAAALAPLRDEPEKLREAWAEAQQRADTNGHKVTAQAVREVVAEIKPRPSASRPLDPDVMERHQRDTAAEVIDRSVFALEGNVGDIPGKIDWILETRALAGTYGLLTPSRLDKAATYCAAFAAELRRRGIDG